MTPRTIESQFSEELLKQESLKFPVDLTEKAKISDFKHPKVLWAELQYKNNPQQEPVKILIPGWNYECFDCLLTAIKKYPQISHKFMGWPWQIYKLLSSGSDEAIIDFQELGSVVISKNPLRLENKNDLCNHTLPHWLSYALSPELWGTNGKWPRFHERISDLLRSKNLLKGQDYPGYYPLVESAHKLKELGFIGSQVDQAYLLVLPWTFPLTSLIKLEEVIQREF